MTLLLLLSLMLGASSHAAAQQRECLAGADLDAPAACPPDAHRARSSGAPHTHVVAPRARAVEHVSHAPRAELSTDAQAEQPRELQLIEREIELLQTLAGRAGADDPRAADYLRRLGETQLELVRVWQTRARSLDQPVADARSSGDAERVQRLERQQAEAEAQVTQVREGAIRTYARLLERFPDHPRVDETLSTLAMSLEQSERWDAARQAHLRLVRQVPESPLVPYSFLALADHAFSEGDMAGAQALYDRVLAIPAERNPVYGYALYKRAWTLFNQEDFRGALTQLLRAIEHAVAHPDSRDAASLARQSRLELVLPYARVGQPAQALAFFRRAAADDAEAARMLERLGDVYRDMGQWQESIIVWHRLMSELPGSDSLCEWQARVTESVIASRPKAEQALEATRLLDVARTFAETGHPPERVTACHRRTAEVVIELATAWHREAIGTPEQPGTRDRRTMELAAELYLRLVQSPLDLEVAGADLLEGVEGSTPAAIAYFQAEIAWALERWSECGPLFDRVLSLGATGALAADAAYSSVLCYDRVYQLDHRDEARIAGASEPPPPRPLTALEQSMIRAFDRLGCYAPDSPERPVAAYRRARLLFDAGHYEAAATGFREVAIERPEHELGEIAANLHLESLHVLARRGRREPCVAAMRDVLPDIESRYCHSTERSEAHPVLCSVVAQLECDLERLRAEAMHAASRHVDAARAYADLAHAGRSCSGLDEVLFDAAMEYEEARLLGRAIQLRRELITRYPESALASRATYLAGANYHAIAMYSEAAELYERFATSADSAPCSPEHAERGLCAAPHDALESAVILRIGLGDDARAHEDARLFEARFRRQRAEETASVMLRVGMLYERAGDWSGASAHYRRFVREHGRHARIEERIRAEVQLGRAEEALGEDASAARHYEAAVHAWQRAEEVIERREGATQEQRAGALGVARMATAEAHFLLAERHRRAFESIRLLALTGAPTLASVLRWQTRELGPWLEQALAALRRAESAYGEAAALHVPEWEIASAERVGQMWASIVERVRSAPVPEAIERDEELYALYVDALESQLNGSGPGPDGELGTADDLACTPESSEVRCLASPLARARSGFEHCLALATRTRWFGATSRRCEERLHGMDPQRYPLAAELRGTASFASPDAAEPQPVSADRDTEALASATPES